MYRVMVVDDEPLVRTAIRSLCDWSSHGFKVDLEARNGGQALRLLRTNPDIDIVLLDIVMPAMDGIELLGRMSSEGYHPHVIVLSAHDSYHLVREAFKAGADDYILKSDLEVSSLLPLLEAVGRSISRGESAPSPPGEAIREEVQVAQGELLRSVLQGRNPTEMGRRLAALGFPDGGPYLLGLIWLDDLESIRFHYSGSGPESFRPALVNTMRQVVDRVCRGDVVALTEDEFAILLFPGSIDDPEQRLEGILDEIRSDARMYFEAALTTRAGRPVREMGLLASECRRLRGYRSGASRMVVRARRYIKEGYFDPALSLSLLSRRLSVSHNYLSSVFRKETGKTITDYITETRIEAAKQLLLTSDLKVYQVSEEVGYRSVEHFCRQFRRATGRSPGAFARRPEPRDDA